MFVRVSAVINTCQPI